MLADPYASKVLNPAIHSRLVADLETYALDARIPATAICTPLSETCGPDEVAYVKRWRFHKGDDIFGLVYIGGKNLEEDVDGRMLAICGALVRNFIRARVMVLSALFDEIDEAGIPDISALLIPNFHVPHSAGGAKSAWKTSNLLDVLMQRRALGLQTIIYVSDLDKVGTEYGSAIRRLITKHYVKIKL